MNKGFYALAGVIFALVVSSIIGLFFSGLGIGLAIGYSICDKGEMLTAVWTKVHPHIDRVFARLILLAGLKPEARKERRSGMPQAGGRTAGFQGEVSFRRGEEDR